MTNIPRYLWIEIEYSDGHRRVQSLKGMTWFQDGFGMHIGEEAIPWVVLRKATIYGPLLDGPYLTTRQTQQ